MEIGSEFSYIKSPYKKETDFDYLRGSDTRFFMCGRGCIDYIIKDILKEQSISKAYLPDYCCQSMIEPFEVNGIECLFYDVKQVDGCLKSTFNKNEKVDVFLRMGNYFGFNNIHYDEEQINELRKNNCIIIEDCTHSIFSQAQHKSSDYYFASIRKWLPVVCGAICSKKNGEFSIENALENIDTSILKLKCEAMHEKNKYLENESSVCKEQFLSKYQKFNSYISNYYELRTADDGSLKIIYMSDYDTMKKIRIENAKFLIDEISKIDENMLVFKRLNSNDVPLFVPIMVSDRDGLQDALKQNNIYCPSHWPKPKSLLSKNRLFDNEISLICDQRYSIEDMKEIIKCIKEWKENKKMEEIQ